MSRQESSLPKHLHSSNWNVVRSKSVPSGVSGSHAVAKQKPLHATDQSMLNAEETVLLRARGAFADSGMTTSSRFNH